MCVLESEKNSPAVYDKLPNGMTRKNITGRTSKILSGYCVVVAENNEGKVKLFGSPSDNANLEVGDEIIEVNGRKLEDATHEDVINHIHESIKSRRVSLKVRRRKGKRLVDEFPTYSIQNAYIVSSDDQAKEDLGQLIKDDAVVPVDMTNFLLDDKPKEIIIPVAGISVDLVVPDNSAPETDETADLSKSKKHTLVNSSAFPESLYSSEELLERTLRNIDTCIQLSRRDNSNLPHIPFGGHKLGIKILSPCLEGASGQFVEVAPMPKESVDAGSLSSSLRSSLGNSGDMTAQVQYNSHREMAIDVPETFVGTLKRPPRYPSVKEEPSPLPSPAMQEAERIRHYQAEIKKRTEAEQSRARQDEILRNSLRSSTKLQSLEKNARPALPPGFYNPAFEEESRAINDTENNGVEILSVPDSQSMKQALDLISSVLKRENSEFSEELDFMKSLFDTAQFRNAADLHHLVESRRLDLIEPVSTNADALLTTVKKLLPSCTNRDAQELQAILSTPQFEQLIVAHDKLVLRHAELAQLEVQTNGAQKKENGGISGHDFSADHSSSSNSEALTIPVYENHQAAVVSSPTPANYVGVDMKVVKIEKSGQDPLGATISIHPETGAVLVARIVCGGTAQRSGLLHEGDELLDVNGFDLRGRSLDEVCDILSKLSGTLTFVIIPNQVPLAETHPKRDYTLHVKANFSYDPEDPTYPTETHCPCNQLGLQFDRGDILHIRSQEDPHWWQAYREGEEIGSTLAGLIPSSSFQRDRENRRRLYMGDSTLLNGGKKASKDIFGKRKSDSRSHGKSERRKKVIGSPFDAEVGDVPPYEEVAVYYPKPSIKRPIVLIGPPHAGRKELRDKVMAIDPDRFAPAVPHTTKSQALGEIQGQTFNFVNARTFKTLAERGHFIEHGEFEKCFYGTSFDAVKNVVHFGKSCILVLEPQSLRLLRASGLKPYVVFVAPPPLAVLRATTLKMGHVLKDDELKATIEKSRELEDTFGHLFDMVIVNADLDRACSELLDAVNRLEREPQWVPADWLR